MASRRDAADVIQRGPPGGPAIRPSNDIPNFAITNGVPVTIQ